jgi:hypothetical protein
MQSRPQIHVFPYVSVIGQMHVCNSFVSKQILPEL